MPAALSTCSATSSGSWATWSQGHQWLIWDGRRWSPDTTGQTKRWMKVIARTVTTEALSITDETKRRNAVKEAKRGESNSAVNGALSLASTEPQIVIDHEDLDADPYLLNTTNGTLDLRTGELRPQDPTDLITKLTGAAYHPDTCGTAFTGFLKRIQPDPDMRAYLARLLGHALVGRLVEHVLPIFWGDGGQREEHCRVQSSVLFAAWTQLVQPRRARTRHQQDVLDRTSEPRL